MGLTKPTTDEHNVTDEIILMDELKQVPPLPTRESGPFNTTNNTSDSYNNSYADRWKHIKTPILCRRRYQEGH